MNQGPPWDGVYSQEDAPIYHCIFVYDNFQINFILQITVAGCPTFSLGRVVSCISAGALYFVVSN